MKWQLIPQAEDCPYSLPSFLPPLSTLPSFPPGEHLLVVPQRRRRRRKAHLKLVAPSFSLFQ